MGIQSNNTSCVNEIFFGTSVLIIRSSKINNSKSDYDNEIKKS